MLPPGQKARKKFPRFGLPPYASRFPQQTEIQSITLEIDASGEFEIKEALAELPRSSMQSDFHCVTTWTYCDAIWGGVKFKDFFEKHIETLGGNEFQIAGAVFHGQDGYRTTLLIEDFIDDSVLIGDSLNDQLLSVEHGAPLRLVAPKHYGYKNLKHLKRIEFYSTMPVVKRGIRAFLDHPRARVSREERGRWIPGWILRCVYRPLIKNTVREFDEAMKKRRAGAD